MLNVKRRAVVVEQRSVEIHQRDGVTEHPKAVRPLQRLDVRAQPLGSGFHHRRGERLG